MDDKKLYRQIIGVVAPWEIEKVELNIDDNRVDVHIMVKAVSMDFWRRLKREYKNIFLEQRSFS